MVLILNAPHTLINYEFPRALSRADGTLQLLKMSGDCNAEGEACSN